MDVADRAGASIVGGTELVEKVRSCLCVVLWKQGLIHTIKYIKHIAIGGLLGEYV